MTSVDPDPPTPTRSPRHDGRLALLLAAAAALLYAPTLGYDFTAWDDPEYVLHNPLIRSLDLASIRAQFTHFYLANYSPLHLLTYTILRAVAGPAAPPWAFHALNVGLHSLCAALGYLVLRRLALPAAAAALGSAIFLAHPAQVEVVAWVNQTKTLLATALGLAALLSLLRFRRDRPEGKGGGAYVGSLLLYAAALLSKPQAIAFPAMYFLAERSLGGGRERLPWRAWVPFGLLAVPAAWAGAQAQATWGAVKLYGNLGLAGNLLETPVLILRYLRLALLPTDLTVVYELRRVESFLDLRVPASAILLGAIAGLAWRLRATPARPWHALGWFLAPLVPVLGWVPLHVPMAERYLYPSLLALGWALGGASEALPARARRWPWVLVALFALLALLRMPAWRNAEAVWETAIRDHPGSAYAWIGRGSYRAERGRLAPAENDFRAAIRLAPDNVDAWTNLGVVLNRLGRPGEAVPAWRRAAAIEPRAVWPKLLLARDLSQRGDHAGAEALYAEAIRLKPGLAIVWLYRAAGRQRTGDTAGAISDLERAAALDPMLTDAQVALGNLLDQRGDRERAIEAYRQALTFAPVESPTIARVRERLETLGAGP